MHCARKTDGIPNTMEIQLEALKLAHSNAEWLQ